MGSGLLLLAESTRKRPLTGWHDLRAGLPVMPGAFHPRLGVPSLFSDLCSKDVSLGSRHSGPPDRPPAKGSLILTRL